MKIFVCTCDPSEMQTFAQNGYILDASPLWTTAPSSPRISSPPPPPPSSPPSTTTPSSFKLPHPDTYNLTQSIFSPTLCGHFTTTPITKHPRLKRMPGSFHHDEDSASSSESDEQGDDEAEQEEETRGRCTTKKMLPNLGREILGLTVLTEKGRRWNVRERGRVGEGGFDESGKGRGRFDGREHSDGGSRGWWGW